MKKEEKDFLGIKKRGEGKSYEQIKEEIKRVNNFSKETHYDKRIIEKLYNQVTRLKEDLSKSKKEIFNLKFSIKSNGQDKNEITISELKKISSLIKGENGISKEELQMTLGLYNKKIDSALYFLKRNKIIVEEKKGMYVGNI